MSCEIFRFPSADVNATAQCSIVLLLHYVHCHGFADHTLLKFDSFCLFQFISLSLPFSLFSPTAVIFYI